MTHISRREFVRIVRRSYLDLPPPIRAALENVDISVEDWPDPEDTGPLAEGSTLFGLYTGIPLTEREGIGGSLPDRIIIFRNPILRSCRTRSQAIREIRVTLLHEVGHCLGLDEGELHQLGYG